MRLISLAFILCFLVSCSWKEYPPEKYIFPKEYRELIAYYHVGDTLKFQNKKGEASCLLITKIDSLLHDERGHFINSAEYKVINVDCEELTNPRKGYDKYTLVYIHKNPTENFAHFNFRYKNFYSRNLDDSLVLKKDTLHVNGLTMTNYYAFRSNDLGDDTTSVAKIYITKEMGLTAYQHVNGEWWTRTK